ncbi:MAG: hypothetical protein MZV64_16825 [Ignavibacteriales bacterium]|nr:hypothetical protein [Ignavibacteriales bacterium]
MLTAHMRERSCRCSSTSGRGSRSAKRIARPSWTRWTPSKPGELGDGEEGRAGSGSSEEQWDDLHHGSRAWRVDEFRQRGRRRGKVATSPPGSWRWTASPPSNR